jgi:hypothetical protein
MDEKTKDYNTNSTLMKISSLKIEELENFDSLTENRSRGYAKTNKTSISSPFLPNIYNSKAISNMEIDNQSENNLGSPKNDFTFTSKVNTTMNFSSSTPNLFSPLHKSEKLHLLRPKSTSTVNFHRHPSTSHMYNSFNEFEDEYRDFLNKMYDENYYDITLANIKDKYLTIEKQLPNGKDLYSYFTKLVEPMSFKEKRYLLYWFLNRKPKGQYEKVIIFKAIIVSITNPFKGRNLGELLEPEKQILINHKNIKKKLLRIALNRICDDYLTENVTITDNMFIPGDILLDTWQGPKVAGKWKHASLNVSFNQKSLDVVECSNKNCRGKTINKLDDDELKDDDDDEQAFEKRMLVRIRFIGNKNIMMSSEELSFKAAILSQILIIGQTSNYGFGDICGLLKHCITNNVKLSLKSANESLDEILDGVSNSFICSSFVIFVWQLILSLYLTDDEIQNIFPLDYRHCSPTSIKKSLFSLSENDKKLYKDGHQIKNKYWCIKLFKRWKKMNTDVIELR